MNPSDKSKEAGDRNIPETPRRGAANSRLAESMETPSTSGIRNYGGIMFSTPTAVASFSPIDSPSSITNSGRRTSGRKSTSEYR